MGNFFGSEKFSLKLVKWKGEKGPPYKFGMGPRWLNPALDGLIRTGHYTIEALPDKSCHHISDALRGDAYTCIMRICFHAFISDHCYVGSMFNCIPIGLLRVFIFFRIRL